MVLPRSSLKSVFGKKAIYSENYKPISFYDFVSNYYPKDREDQFLIDVQDMNDEAFAKEALEQHYTVSHVVQQKDNTVALAGSFLFCALFLTGISLFFKVVW